MPLLIIWAPSWGWIVFANVLLGVNQGLTWSTTVIMKIDLVGPERRGLAMGFNEAAGYGAVAITALATGYIAERAGLRPEPFFLGIAYAGLGLALSTLFVRETHGHARHEARDHDTNASASERQPSTREVFALTTFRERALSSCSQAGLVNNLNDGLAWGLFPIYFAARGPVDRPHRRARRGLPGNLGSRPTRHRRPLRSRSAASGSSPAACSPKPSPSDGSPRRPASYRGCSAHCCSESAPRWCIRHSSPRSATSRIHCGVHARSASIGCGETPASRSARSSPASSPTPSVSRSRSGPSRR